MPKFVIFGYMQEPQNCSFVEGDVINNTFTVKSTLGEGAYGRVYAAQDYMGNIVALKLLKLWEVPQDIRKGLVQRFDMEFYTAQIDCPYLVRSLGYGNVLGNPYIVMEYCPNGDLTTTKINVDPVKVAWQVLNGLEALHSCGKVHRDLKPENVLVKGNGDFALTDFGISGDRNNRMTQRNFLGRAKQIFGTYAYMPPEQLNRKREATVLPTTDIFSFGVMMYFLLTGALPFGVLQNDDDIESYLLRSANGAWDKEKLNSVNNSKQWIEVIGGCLQPDFNKRYPTVKEVMKHLPRNGADGSNVAKSTNIFRAPEVNNVVRGLLLRVMQGDEFGRIYYLNDIGMQLNSAILTVGRADSNVHNDIPIYEAQSSFISRRHCTFEIDQTCRWYIRDGQWNASAPNNWKRSTNGTFIGSTEVGIDRVPIKPGDIISIGDVKMRVEGY